LRFGKLRRQNPVQGNKKAFPTAHHAIPPQSGANLGLKSDFKPKNIAIKSDLTRQIAAWHEWRELFQSQLTPQNCLNFTNNPTTRNIRKENVPKTMFLHSFRC